MKKLVLAIASIFISTVALADWEVTVSGWTPSSGPDLAYEDVLMDGVAQCSNILPSGTSIPTM